MKYLIVADDLGISNERNKGILESIKNGIVTNTSIMANGPFSKEAIEIFKKEKLLNTIGLHLNLTEGLSISNYNNIKTLVDNNTNKFIGKLNFRYKYNKGLIKKEEILIEIEAQIKWFISNIGYYPKFINGHQHCHILPDMCYDISCLFKKYHIDYIRIPYEPNPKNKHCELCSIINNDAKKCSVIYGKFFRINYYFIGLSFCSKIYSVEELIESIEKIDTLDTLDTSICEIMVHPGYREPENIGWDLFSESKDRETELYILCNKKIRELNISYLIIKN